MVLRAPIVGGGLSPIQIQKGKSCKRAFYQGLMSCGSVWNCPICASKIAERRRSELKQALDNARSMGLNVHFVTLTVPHGIGDDLNHLLDGLKGALKRLSSGMHSISSQLKSDLVGFIRMREVTHGNQNGWHPHFHLLVFTKNTVTAEQLKSIYQPSWQRACRLAGLPIPSDLHGCTVQDGTKAGNYISKWGLEDEMTKSHIKQTRRKGVTPWGLLRCILDGNDIEYSTERATALFRVYSAAFKGSRQLHWSTGLRDALGVSKELTDKEITDLPDDERASLISTLSVDDWRVIRKNKAESSILDAAEGGSQSVTALLNQLNKTTKRGKPMLYVGFYHPKKRKIVHVEKWDSDLQDARMSAIYMTQLYLSGDHSMPSPLWCLWDDANLDISSVFILDNKEKTEELLNAASDATREYMENSK